MDFLLHLSGAMKHSRAGAQSLVGPAAPAMPSSGPVGVSTQASPASHTGSSVAQGLPRTTRPSRPSSTSSAARSTTSTRTSSPGSRPSASRRDRPTETLRSGQSCGQVVRPHSPMPEMMRKSRISPFTQKADWLFGWGVGRYNHPGSNAGRRNHEQNSIEDIH